jgi:hypothetical protein
MIQGLPVSNDYGIHSSVSYLQPLNDLSSWTFCNSTSHNNIYPFSFHKSALWDPNVQVTFPRPINERITWPTPTSNYMSDHKNMTLLKSNVLIPGA